MPRPLVCALAALAVAVPAWSQAAPPDAPGRGPNAAERVLLVVGALGGGFASAYVVGPAAPLGAAAGVYGTGRALGFDASLGTVALSTAAGTAVSVGAAAATFYVVTEVQGYDADLSASIGSAAVGLAVGATAMALLYDGRRADAVPAALAAPGGRPAPGLALRVRL